MCILGVEELRFLKGTTATIICPLTLKGVNSGNFDQETEDDPAYLLKALKVVFFYKGKDSQYPLAIYDNRVGGNLSQKSKLSSWQFD